MGEQKQRVFLTRQLTVNALAGKPAPGSNDPAGGWQDVYNLNVLFVLAYSFIQRMEKPLCLGKA